MDQAKHLKLDLLAVPLPPMCGNVDYIDRVNDALSVLQSKHMDADPESGALEIELVFGDLHLEAIKSWREESFRNYSCSFPLFQVRVFPMTFLCVSPVFIMYFSISTNSFYWIFFLLLYTSLLTHSHVSRQFSSTPG